MKSTHVSTSKSAKAHKAAAAAPLEESAVPADPVAEGEADGEDRDTFIRRTAYAYYEARGRVHGHELDDWLKAEAEFERVAGGASDAAQAH